MDNNDPQNPNAPMPPAPTAVPTQPDADEEKALEELKKLQSEEQAEVAADAKIVDDREAESKMMESIEKTDPQSLATPTTPPNSEPTETK